MTTFFRPRTLRRRYDFVCRVCPSRLLFALAGFLSSGSATDATDEALTPMGMIMQMRLPYGMQIGDQALRLNAAVTHVYIKDDLAIGGQAGGKFKVDAKDWHFGNSQQLTVWAQHSINSHLALSSRLTYVRVFGLKGMDALITAPVQTAIPANYGHRQWRVGLGANVIMPLFFGAAERLGIELEIPFETDARGVQMTPKWQFTLGIQKSF